MMLVSAPATQPWAPGVLPQAFVTKPPMSAAMCPTPFFLHDFHSGSAPAQLSPWPGQSPESWPSSFFPSGFSQVYCAQQWLCYFSHANLQLLSSLLTECSSSPGAAKPPITELLPHCQASAHAISSMWTTLSPLRHMVNSHTTSTCPRLSSVCPLFAALALTHHLLGCPKPPLPNTFLRAGPRTYSLGIREFNKGLQNEGETLKSFTLYKRYVMKGSVQNAWHFRALFRRVSLWLSRKILSKKLGKHPPVGLLPRAPRYYCSRTSWVAVFLQHTWYRPWKIHEGKAAGSGKYEVKTAHSWQTNTDLWASHIPLCYH